MNTISIFAQPPYLLRNLRRVSSIIRGEQIAAYIPNARLNPPNGYENDVCIYVKPNVKPEQDFTFEGHPYLDIVDGFALYHLLNKHPDVPVIVVSEYDVKTMSKYVKNKIILIPHHHCNFERIGRRNTGNAVKNVGMIGSEEAFAYIPDAIRHGLADRGIQLVTHSIMYPRTIVTKFYSQMDVMMVWSPYNAPDKPGLYNPFKIVNAAAFGLPTVALDKPTFHEMEGCYIPVQTPEEFLTQLDALRTSITLYNDMSNLCLEKSEKYHIEHIIKLYQQLK